MWEGRSRDLNPGTRCVPLGFAGNAEAWRGCRDVPTPGSPRGRRRRGRGGVRAHKGNSERTWAQGESMGLRRVVKYVVVGEEVGTRGHRDVKCRRKDKEGICRKNAEANKRRRPWGRGKKGTGCAWEHGHVDLEC